MADSLEFRIVWTTTGGFEGGHHLTGLFRRDDLISQTVKNPDRHMRKLARRAHLPTTTDRNGGGKHLRPLAQSLPRSIATHRLSRKVDPRWIDPFRAADLIDQQQQVLQGVARPAGILRTLRRQDVTGMLGKKPERLIFSRNLVADNCF